MLDSGLGTAKKIKEIRINLHFFLWNDFSANLLNSKKYHRWYFVDVIAFFKIPEMSKMRLKWKIKQYVKYLKWEKVISSQNDDCVVGSLGEVGVPGEKRCGLMSLINNWPGFFLNHIYNRSQQFPGSPQGFLGTGRSSPMTHWLDGIFKLQWCCLHPPLDRLFTNSNVRTCPA